MTIEIERWLGQMISALLVSGDGAKAFVRLMGSMATDDRGGGVDWIHFGQMIRAELGWVDYPAHPPQTTT